MKKKTWALKLVGRHTLDDKKLGPIINFPRTVKLLQSEHARAVRIVKRAKRLELHGLRDTDTNEFLEGYEASCNDILAAIQKGRA